MNRIKAKLQHTAKEDKAGFVKELEKVYKMAGLCNSLEYIKDDNEFVVVDGNRKINVTADSYSAIIYDTFTRLY